MDKSTDVLIVGGGLNGPALALALAQGGLSSVIVDAMPRETRTDPEFDGRGYALALSSQRMLEAIGVWPRVADNAQPILDIKVSDGRAGEGAAPWFVHFDHREIEEGPMGYILEDRYLRRALLDALDAEARITHLDGIRVVGQQVDGVSAGIELDDGQRLAGSLIAGCDGRDSRVAKRAGITRVGWSYHQTALVCAVSHEKPHNGTAHQFFMPPGPLAILPLPGNMSAIVWSETSERARAIGALGDADYMRELRPRFGDFLGDISLAGKRFSYPLRLSLASSFIADRIALAGDAAHGIHPLAGQGLNLGLRDVAALAEVLTGARRLGEDIGSLPVLERYQQWRRFDTAGLVAATDGINWLFSNDNPAVRAARDAGLGLVNAIPALRRALIREAAGLTGDLPKLLQGRPL
ncbi:MAG: FAD-dependent monooxygenase [Paracoccaceae bacterium]